MTCSSTSHKNGREAGERNARCFFFFYYYFSANIESRGSYVTYHLSPKDKGYSACGVPLTGDSWCTRCQPSRGFRQQTYLVAGCPCFLRLPRVLGSAAFPAREGQRGGSPGRRCCRLFNVIGSEAQRCAGSVCVVVDRIQACALM